VGSYLGRMKPLENHLNPPIVNAWAHVCVKMLERYRMIRLESKFLGFGPQLAEDQIGQNLRFEARIHPVALGSLRGDRKPPKFRSGDLVTWEGRGFGPDSRLYRN
jgi:hypothetical protein